MKHTGLAFLTAFWLLTGSQLLACKPGDAGGKSFLWKVSKDGKICYVLGSVHMMKKESYPLPQAIEDAFNQAEVLSLEADVSDVKMSQMSAIAFQRGMYPENDSLEKHLSAESLEFLRNKIVPLGLSIEFISRMKPWMAAMTIVSLETIRAGYDPNLGIDRYFAQKAQNRMPIVELEGIEFQINLFENLSSRENEKFLVYTLKEAENTVKNMETIMGFWRNGDASGMESILSKTVGDDTGLMDIFKKINDNRNIGMADKIMEYLRSGKVHLATAGALHMVGENGVINLLRQKGCDIEQL